MKAKEIKDNDYAISKIHNHMLHMQSIKQLSEYTNVRSFRCDGRNHKGCKSKQGGFESDSPKSEVYHCFTCGADFCTECNSGYSHVHPLKLVEFSEISGLKKYSENDGKWRCDARHYNGCKSGDDKNFNAQDDITYCCRQCDFDLCSECIKTYKA